MIPLIERLKLILSEILAIPSETITDDATLESLGADSLDLVDISCEILDQTGADVQESEMKLSMTVAELAAMIESKL